MELTQELMKSIQRSILLKEETKHQLINNWWKLDNRTKKNIIDLLEEKNEIEYDIFAEFIEKFKNWWDLIKSKINLLKQKALKIIEEKKYSNIEKELDSKLEEI